MPPVGAIGKSDPLMTGNDAEIAAEAQPGGNVDAAALTGPSPRSIIL